MQRLFNVSKWSELQPGQVIDFTNDKPRKVTVDVNSEGQASLHIVTPHGGTRFLATFVGRDTLEFYVGGKFGLTTAHSGVFVHTVDGDGHTFRNLDAESFTVVKERRERNPELEYIIQRMGENMQRRMEVQSNELAKLFHQRQSAAEAKLAAEIARLHAASPAGEPAVAAASGEGPGGDDRSGGPGGRARPRKAKGPPDGSGGSPDGG